MVGNSVKNNLKILTFLSKIFRYILKKELITIRKLLYWKELIKNMEFDKFKENLERMYP